MAVDAILHEYDNETRLGGNEAFCLIQCITEE
jgi:hypothetical protein